MSPIERLQRDIDGRLKSWPYFADKPSFVYRPREKESAAVIDTKINSALAGLLKQGGKSGIALSVFMPLCDVPDADLHAPAFDVFATVRIAEMPMVNMGATGTRASAEEVAFEAATLLHDVSWGPIRAADRLALAKDALTPIGAIDETGTKLAYDLKLRCRVVVPRRQKVETPEISGDAAAVQLTCSTAGAAIYFTIDEAYPRPSLAEETALGAENPNKSTLYTVPFAVTAGTFVRACAYLAPRLPSDLAQVTIS